MDTLCHLLMDKLAYAEGERDLALMQHQFRIRNADGTLRSLWPVLGRGLRSRGL